MFIVIFVLTLLVLVISHEFGHFIVAKKFGIKVLEFGFGLPPRLWGKKVGETLVSLNLLPIGGFVRLFGEDEVDKKVLENKRSFAARPVGQRVGVVVAGVAMNLLLAIIIFWIVLAAQGFREKIPLLFPYHFVGVEQTDESIVLVGRVVPGSPAESASLSPGDQIAAVNGQSLDSGGKLVNITKEHAGEKITLLVINPEEQKREVTVVPRVSPPEGQGPLGVELGTLTVANLDYATPGQKIASAFTRSYNLVVYSGVIFGNLISQSIETKNIEPVSQSVAGPVGITEMVKMILQTKSPLIPYLNFLGLLSLNLAVINILPFPALDGGRLIFLLIEAAFQRKVKAEVERWVHTIGMAFLIALILLITFSDIKKFFP